MTIAGALLGQHWPAHTGRLGPGAAFEEAAQRTRRRHHARAFLSTMQDAMHGAEPCSVVHLSWTQQAGTSPNSKQRMSLSFSAAHWEELLRVLACSDAALRSVVQRWPGISRLPVPEVMQRLLSLKVLLPRCNVAAMVALQPALFLNRTPDQIRAQVGGAHDIISRALPPAYVDAMIQERPAILFIDTACLPQAVEQLKDVLAYPTDPASLSNLLWAVKQDPPAARDAAAGAHSKKAGPLAWGEPP